MWMTSNFRAKLGALALLLAAFLVCLAALARAASSDVPAAAVPPDAPRPMRAQPEDKRRLVAQPMRGTIELRSVVVRPLDEKYSRLAGPEFLRAAETPLYVEVQTQKPLGNLVRDAAPVIVLNNERLMNTRPVAVDRLVAFLPDQRKLAEVNIVAVIWLGEAAPTKTRRPLRFKREDIGK